MFHRTNNGADVPTKNLDVTEYDEPEQHSFQYQAKIIEQSAVERYAKTEAVQVASQVPPANQSQPLTQNQFYVYESPTYEEAKDTHTMTPEIDNKTDSKNEQGNVPSRIDIPGGVFSRPGQQAPIAGRVPGAYPGAYPGAASAAPTYGQAVTSQIDPASGRKLYIGQGITLSGEIESCDHLVVEGTVEAALKGASVLEIAEAGAYFGTVDIDEATIAGRFEGDLTVRGRLTVKASGSITGSITYKELAIEAGATIDGKLSPLDAKNTASRGKTTNNKTSKPNEYGAELPFEGKAVAAE